MLIYVVLQWWSAGALNGDLEYLNSNDSTSTCAHSRRPFDVLSHSLTPKDQIELYGWWQDQATVRSDVQCFNEPWALCSTAFSITCKPTTIRAIYQYVPFKRHVRLMSFRLSVRASAEQLESQTSDPFLGALVLVKLSDGSEEYYAVSFSPSTSTVTQRVGTFTVSKSARTIYTATVMLGCYGYVGIVHFTDVVLTPLVEANRNCRVEDFLEDCPQNIRGLHYEPKIRHELILGKVKPSSRKRHLTKDVALVTQLSMDRIPMLQHTLHHWEGPVSLVVHVPIKAGQRDTDWQKVYIQKKLQNLKLHPDSHVTLAYETPTYGDYPINALRNLAMRQTNCEYLLVVDADFQPSPDFHKHFLLSTRSVSNHDKTAFVVPAFEYIDVPQKSDGVPQTKEELMQLLHRQDPFVQPFRQDVSPDSHRATDYWMWYRTDRPYRVSTFGDKYEPYVVLKNTVHLPPFDERFSGYGMNKITHVTELFAAGYVFFVLPDVWLIHVPHKPSAYSIDHVQNPRRRLQNRVQRFEFLVDLWRRYKLGRCSL